MTVHIGQDDCIVTITIDRERKLTVLDYPTIDAGPAGMREDDRAQPPLLLHIACQAGGQILVGLPARYLCGAPVSLLLTRITPGDGPDGPGVCPICAALDHPGRARPTAGE